MRRTLVTVIVLLLAASVALPAAFAHHRVDHVQGQASVTAQGPRGHPPDLSGSDDVAGTTGVQVRPTPGDSKLVQVRVDVDDDNGHNDISSVEVVIYQPDNSTVHRTAGTATKDAGNGKRGTFVYSFQMAYYDAPGTYHVRTDVTDRDGLTDTTWSTFEYLGTTAVSSETTSVTFDDDASDGDASLTPGSDTTTSPSNVSLSNAGNEPVDLQYSGTHLTNATSGASIDISNVQWSTASNMSNAQAFSTTVVTDTTFDLPVGGSATLYVAIAVPTGLPAGTYTGSMTLAAVADA